MENKSLELVHLFDKLAAIKAFIFDVDGVLTDNTVLVTEQNEFLRTMHIRDGQAIKWAVQAGYHIGIITGGRSTGVVERLAGLGIEQIYTGRHEKHAPYLQFLQTYQLDATEVCYMGDDLPDLPVMRKVGLPACPNDAVPEVIDAAGYISPIKGGAGCVRDIIEKVMKIQEKWPEY